MANFFNNFLEHNTAPRRVWKEKLPLPLGEAGAPSAG